MRNHQHTPADIDYTAYLAQVGCDMLEEAVSTCGLSRKTMQEYFPSLVSPLSTSDTSLSFTARTSSKDYFVFYQENDRWAWRRVNQADSRQRAAQRLHRSARHTDKRRRRSRRPLVGIRVLREQHVADLLGHRPRHDQVDFRVEHLFAVEHDVQRGRRRSGDR